MAGRSPSVDYSALVGAPPVPRTIAADEVRSWFKRPGSLSDDQARTIAAELTAWRWPCDPRPVDLSDDGRPLPGAELDAHKNVAKSFDVLGKAMPDTLEAFREYWPDDKAAAQAIEDLQAAIDAATPAMQRIWGQGKRPAGRKAEWLHSSDSWKAGAVRLDRLFSRYLVAPKNAATLSVERDSVLVGAMLPALKRMQYAGSPALSAATLSQHLKRRRDRASGNAE